MSATGNRGSLVHRRSTAAAASIVLAVASIVGCATGGEPARDEEELRGPVDGQLPPEPRIPTVCAGATLDAPHAVRSTGDVRTDGLPIYDPAALDTAAIQAAIEACAASLAPGQKGAVRLRVNASDPARVAFIAGPLFLRAGVTLWIDSGATLFAAQDPRLYDARGPGTCGTDANNNSNGCLSLINV